MNDPGTASTLTPYRGRAVDPAAADAAEADPLRVRLTLPRRSRAPLYWGAASALGAALLGVVVSMNPVHPALQRLDARWLAWMGGPHTGFPHAVAMALNWFGGPSGVLVPLALALLLAGLRRWWSLLYFATAYLVGNLLVVQLLKHAVDRPRPALPLVTVDHGSFPSGHAFAAALLVVLVGVLLVRRTWWRWYWPLGTLFVLTMMWSRTWLHAHWLSDTVAGALAGTGTALLLWCAFAPLLSRERTRRREIG